MANLPRYENYKDSGVEWLGEIPKSWTITRMSNFGFFSKGQGISKAQVSESGFPALLYGDIYTKYEIKTDQLVTRIPASIANNSEKIYRSNLCFTASGETIEDIGKCVLYDSDKVGYAGGDIIIFRQTKQHSLYLSYLFNSYFFREQKAKLAKGEIIVHIYSSKLKTIKFCLPPIAEQKRIAEFLDRKCAEIDEAITKKERLIELLEEQKNILINQAVTKGLNPDAPTKDSGIDWLGDIPQHWQLKRIKNIFKLIIEQAPDNNDMELLSVYSDIGVKPRKELEERGNKASTTDGYWIVKKGDFIINKLLAWMGALGLSNYDGVTSPAYDILRPRVCLSGEYFNYVLRMPTCTAELKRHSRGIMEMRLRLYFDKFGALYFPFPPETEQKEIAEFLETKLSECDYAKAKNLEQIKKLTELKQILIAEAVTGKIKV